MRSTERSRSIAAICTPSKTDAIQGLALVPPSPTNRSVQHQLCGAHLCYLNIIFLHTLGYVSHCSSVVFPRLANCAPSEMTSESFAAVATSCLDALLSPISL